MPDHCTTPSLLFFVSPSLKLLALQRFLFSFFFFRFFFLFTSSFSLPLPSHSTSIDPHTCQQNSKPSKLDTAEQNTTRNSMSSGRQDVSTAELGQVDPRSSIDGDESTSLLPTQQQQQHSGNNNSNSGKRLSATSNGSSRSLSERARKKIIITLTFISGALLVILAFTLVGKVGAPPGMCIHATFISDDQEKALFLFRRNTYLTIGTMYFYIVIEKNTPVLVKAKHGAVAAEEIHCSEIGVEGNNPRCSHNRILSLSGVPWERTRK